MSVFKGNNFHAKAIGDYESVCDLFKNFILVTPKTEMASKFIPVKIGYKTKDGYESLIPNDDDKTILTKFVDNCMVYTKSCPNALSDEEKEEVFLLYEIINFPTDYKSISINSIKNGKECERYKLIFEVTLQDKDFLTRTFYHEVYWYPKEKKYIDLFDDTYSMLEAIFDQWDNGIFIDDCEGKYYIQFFDSFGHEISTSHTMDELLDMVTSKRLFSAEPDK